MRRRWIGRTKTPARARGLWRLGLLVVLLPWLGACGSTPKPRPIEPGVDLHHPDPGRRALAVQQVAAAGDRSRVPDLIELLDDRDESVRLVAGGALTDLTGRAGSYEAFAPRAERLEAMAAWRAWYAGSGNSAESRP